MTAAAAHLASAGRTSRFYLWMAVGFPLCAFLGFAPTYWAPMAAGAFRGNPIVHIRGWVFFAWTLFFIAQTGLAANGRIVGHRAFGILGASLVTAMAILALLVALNSLRIGEAMGVGVRAESFTIVPLSDIALFAVFMLLALANTARPEMHKRLMMLAMISILDPALARPFLAFVFTSLPPGPQPVWAPLPADALADLFLVAAIVCDVRARGKPHPAYLVGGAGLIAVQRLRLPVSDSVVWHEAAHSFAGLAGSIPMHG
jgi:hypothetical protein